MSRYLPPRDAWMLVGADYSNSNVSTMCSTEAARNARKVALSEGNTGAKELLGGDPGMSCSRDLIDPFCICMSSLLQEKLLGHGLALTRETDIKGHHARQLSLANAFALLQDIGTLEAIASMSSQQPTLKQAWFWRENADTAIAKTRFAESYEPTKAELEFRADSKSVYEQPQAKEMLNAINDWESDLQDQLSAASTANTEEEVESAWAVITQLLGEQLLVVPTNTERSER